MNASQNTTPTKLISQLLLEDADLRDVVEEFVQGLPGRLEEFAAARERLDFELLATLAHRLKGAAGSYGYPDISRVCADLEQRFRNHQADGFDRAVQALNDLVHAAQQGLEGHSPE